MSDDIKEIGNKLNEINSKLDVVGGGLNSIVETLTNLGQAIGISFKNLVGVVENYSQKVAMQSQTDFESYKKSMEVVDYEINSIRTSMLGTSQIIGMSQSLFGLIEILDSVAFDPEEIKIKLNEIKDFLNEKKGVKE